MYYISFKKPAQEYLIPSSITCVNSMETTYIPIARGFTTHWTNKKKPPSHIKSESVALSNELTINSCLM